MRVSILFYLDIHGISVKEHLESCPDGPSVKRLALLLLIEFKINLYFNTHTHTHTARSWQGHALAWSILADQRRDFYLIMLIALRDCCVIAVQI